MRIVIKVKEKNKHRNAVNDDVMVITLTTSLGVIRSTNAAVVVAAARTGSTTGGVLVVLI